MHTNLFDRTELQIIAEKVDHRDARPPVLSGSASYNAKLLKGRQLSLRSRYASHRSFHEVEEPANVPARLRDIKNLQVGSKEENHSSDGVLIAFSNILNPCLAAFWLEMLDKLLSFLDERFTHGREFLFGREPSIVL